MHADAPLPSSDATLAALLATWGYRLDERQRAVLAKRDPAIRSETDRLVKFQISDLRRLVGSAATQRELRSLLEQHFESAANA
jgi:hypothetical protein